MMGMRRFAYGYEGPKDERSMAAAKEIAELMARKGFSYAEVDAIPGAGTMDPAPGVRPGAATQLCRAR